MPATLTRKDDALVLDLSTTGRGSEFNDALRKVKDIPGATFDWDAKLWSVPDEPANAERILKTIKPTAEDDLLEWLRAARVRAAEEVTTPLPDDGAVLVPWGTKRMPWQPEKVNGEPFNGLFDYQRSFVRHIARNRRALLADDMGLGKTIQTIGAVEEFRLLNRFEDGTLPDGPKLVICPFSVLGSWLRELNRWLEPGMFGVQLIDGYSAKKRHEQLIQAIKDDLWIVANWEALRTTHQIIEIQHRNGLRSKEKRVILKEPLYQVPWAAYMDLSLDDLDPRTVDRLKNAEGKVKAGKWLAIAADEAHKAKNPSALQARGLHRVRTAEGLMLALTGTPIMNAPGEMWSILHWLWPETFSSHGRFCDAYEDGYEIEVNGHKKKEVTGVKNADALRFQVRGKVIRRTAGQLKKLSGHRRIFFEVEMLKEQKKAYIEAERQMWLGILKDAQDGKQDAVEIARMLAEDEEGVSLIRIPNSAVRTTRLRQIMENLALLGGPDVSAVMDDFEERFEGTRPEPWFVGTAFRESAYILADRLRKRHKAEVGVYTGDQSMVERTQMEDDFQAGNLDAIIGTIAATNSGITLTRTNKGYMLSEDWVPAINEQWQRRYADRTGQTRKATTFIPKVIGSVGTAKVRPANELKEQIVRAVYSVDKIEEVHA